MEQSSIYQSRLSSQGISEDEFKWIINMALCESVVEQYALGKMLYDGFIIEKHAQKGLYFLTLAASKNHLLAQAKLIQALEEQGEEETAKRWRKRTQALLARY